MNYNNFVKELQYNVQDHIEHSIVYVGERDGKKCLNVSFDGIIARSIEIDPLWAVYMETDDLDTCVDVVQSIVTGFDSQGTNRGLLNFADYDEIKNFLVPDIQLTEDEKEFPLKNGLRLNLGADLYAVPVVPVSADAQLVIRNGLFKQWGITSENLWTDILGRMARDYPAYIMDFKDYVKLSPGKKEWEGFLPVAKVVTSGINLWGNTAILYPDIRKELQKIFGGDFLVLFTSYIEVITAPLNEIEWVIRFADYCANALSEKNEGMLSEKVYLMRADAGVMELAN